MTHPVIISRSLHLVGLTLLLSMAFGCSPAARSHVEPAPSIQWHSERQALLLSLDTLDQDLRHKSFVGQLRTELNATDNTLITAKQLIDQQASNSPMIHETLAKLEGHQKKIQQLHTSFKWSRGGTGVKQGTNSGSRQLAMTNFQNIDQKTSQYTNMLSTIMKALKDTETGIIRNMN